MHLLAITFFAGALWAQPALNGTRSALWNIVPESIGPADPWESAVADSIAKMRAERALHRWSLIALVTANAADAAFSWHLQEGNPLMAGRGGRFGMQSVMFKSGIVGVSMLAQRAITRRRPEWLKRMAWVNLATAGALGAIAHHNAGLR